MAFYHLSQNKSGGGFDFDEAAGITHNVVIEADSAEEATERAESIGCYWNGVAKGGGGGRTARAAAIAGTSRAGTTAESFRTSAASRSAPRHAASSG